MKKYALLVLAIIGLASIFLESAMSDGFPAGVSQQGAITGNGAGLTNIQPSAVTNGAGFWAAAPSTGGSSTNGLATIAYVNIATNGLGVGNVNSNSPVSVLSGSLVVATNISAGGTETVGGADTAYSYTGIGAVNYLSPSNGQNTYYDMTVGNAQYPGQLGMSFYGTNYYSEYGLWVARAPGNGTNVWGAPIEIRGGVSELGDPNWEPNPNSPYAYAPSGLGYGPAFYMGFGPQNSSVKAVYASGVVGSGPATQPYLSIVNANPWGGGAGLNIRSGFSGITHGFFQGVSADGTNIYVSQFGLQLLELTPDYGAGELQQAGSHCILGSDPSLSLYVSQNGYRTNDHVLSQIPELVIDTTTFQQTPIVTNSYNQAIHPLFRVPLQVSNVWMTTNVNWRDSVLVDEDNGNVTATNGLITLGTVSALGVISGNGSGLTNLVKVYQAGLTNVALAGATSFTVSLNTSFPTTNWVPSLTENGATIPGLAFTAITVNSFTASMTALTFTGNLLWTATYMTQSHP